MTIGITTIDNKTTNMAEPIIIEKTYDAPVEKVWAAFTDKNKMREWYFNVSDFKPEVGFEFTFEGGKPGGEVYIHECRVTEVVPMQKLSHTWKYKGYEGNTLLMLEFFREGENKTRVKLTHAGIETFPKSNPDLARENFVAGWTEIMGNQLPKFLEK